jgi:hypothetical protein
MTSKLVRVSVVMVGALVALVAAGQAASATTLAANEAAAQAMAFPVGPVGITAVALGFGGLIVGLLRHRRREAGGAALPAANPSTTPEPAAPERAA